MFGHHDRGGRQLDYLAAALGRATAQGRLAVGTLRQGMDLHLGRHQAVAAGVVETALARPWGPDRRLGRLVPRHPLGSIRLRIVPHGLRAELRGNLGQGRLNCRQRCPLVRKLAFKVGDPVLLLADNREQILAVGVGEVKHTAILRLR